MSKLPNKVINYDCVIKKFSGKHIPKKTQYSPQQPFRMLMSARSGGGKTMLLINLLFNQLTYDRIIIYSKSLHQDKYKFLISTFADIDKKKEEYIDKLIDKEQQRLNRLEDSGKTPNHEAMDALIQAKSGMKRTLEAYENDKDLLPVDDYKDDENVIVIFDDIQNTKNQDILVSYFSQGRHKRLSCIYICQSYFRTPKLIRDNISVYSFHGKTPVDDQSRIYRTLAIGLPKEKFIEIWNNQIRSKYDFFYIDTCADEPFRRNFYEKIKGLTKDELFDVEDCEDKKNND